MSTAVLVCFSISTRYSDNTIQARCGGGRCQKTVRRLFSGVHLNSTQPDSAQLVSAQDWMSWNWTARNRDTTSQLYFGEYSAALSIEHCKQSTTCHSQWTDWVPQLTVHRRADSAFTSLGRFFGIRTLYMLYSGWSGRYT